MSKLQDQLQNAVACHRSGKLTQAEAAYRRVLEINTDQADAVHLLGMVAHQKGAHDDALELLRHAVSLDPSAAHFHNNLGNALARKGLHKAAVASFRMAIGLRPDYAEAHHNLGLAFEHVEKPTEALEAFDQALEARPGNAETHFHRGKALQNLRRLQEAVAALRQAIILQPDIADAHRALAACYGDMGDQPGVIECHCRNTELVPKFAPGGSDLVHVLHYDPRFTPPQLFEAAKRWAQFYAEPLTAKGVEPHQNDRSPDRTMRVGYVSADFHDHPVARLMVPTLTHLNRSQFATVCYSDSTDGDRMNTHLQGLADEWRNVSKMPDHALAKQIRDDRIDILVDLAGHMNEFKRVGSL